MHFAIVTLVLKMRVIVILIVSVKMALCVELGQTNVQVHLVLTLKLIVVINQLLEMNIFVQLCLHVERMKEIVIPIVNVNTTTFVGQITVQIHLV